MSIDGHERADMLTRLPLDLDDLTGMEASYGDLVGRARDHYNDKEQTLWTNGTSITKEFNEERGINLTGEWKYLFGAK